MYDSLPAIAYRMADKIYIVEDHPAVREALCAFLERVPGLAVCGLAGSGEEALEDRTTRGADLALIDLSLPGMTGADLVRMLTARTPSLRCLMLSARSEPTAVRTALAAGACGYVVKDDPDELVHAIRWVVNEGTYLSASIRAA